MSGVSLNPRGLGVVRWAIEVQCLIKTEDRWSKSIGQRRGEG